MSNIKKDEEVKNGHGIEEDGEMKKDTAGEVQLSKQIYDQVASARFDQYILPEEGDLRKILRYRSMLDRELSFCLDQLDRLKKIRIANPSSNL